MNYHTFIGIDVSKKWLDVAVMVQNQLVFHMQVDNSKQGIQSFFKHLKKEIQFQAQHTVFCMEYTGIYNAHILHYLHKKQMHICVESGLQIKQSSGLQRGKNDKVDAQRIAQYAYKNRDELRLWQPARPVIAQLKSLIGLRSRLVNALKQLSTPVQEVDGFVSKTSKKLVEKNCSHAIAALKKDIKRVESEIQALVKADPELDRIFTIVTSVKGVGAVVAAEVIVATNEFKDIREAKKFACYCGVAPFEHRSGSSIRGRTRVSKMGNKTIKTLMHLAALVATQYDEELHIYYKRKVEQGKNKMSVLNAVRNKLIHRIFACVKANRVYEKKAPLMLA